MRHTATNSRFLCSRAPRARAGGFTVIELLIAMAILLAITAVVVPFSGARIRDAVRADAADQIEAAIWSARSEARLHNTPVRVLAVPTERGMSLVAEASRRSTDEPDATRPQLPLADLGEMRIRLGAASGDDRSGESAQAASDDEGEVGAVTVATVLPDGAAVVATGLRLVDDRGGAQTLRIDPVALSVTATDEAADADDEAGEPDPVP